MVSFSGVLMHMLKAVIFDWDGTLSDTMPTHFSAFRDVLRDMVSLQPEQVYEKEGMKGIDIIAELAGIPVEKARPLAERKQELFRSRFRKGRLYPGAADLLKSLKEKGLLLGLVTGTARKNIEYVMRRKTMELFDHITTADETRNTKPHPEPFLSCLEDLSLNPGEAVVVENAPLGIKSAKAAGLRCIAVASTLPESRLKEADFVVKSLQDAGGIIEKLAGQN